MSGKEFLAKIKEAFLSVFPITIVIFALILICVPTPQDLIIKLSISAILLILGIGIFSLGADSSMIELGSGVGATLSNKSKLWFMLVCGVCIGFIITFAEPDLMVLAGQVVDFSSLNSTWLFISVVSIGVGILLMLGILRVYFKIKLSILLLISYGIVFILSFFVPPEFVPIAFDSGSVTTGPISVPFLIAFGLGLSAVRESKDEEDNSFGMIALCSVGPIISVMFLSLFIDSSSSSVTLETTQNLGIAQEMFSTLGNSLLDVAIILLPIIIIFILFQIFAFKYPKTKVIRMLFGFFLTYIGISLFLTGVECGYLPMGRLMGEYFGGLSNSWVAILIGLILGAFAIIAEPALHVLKKQVEDVTNGTIKQSVIVVTISLGVALAVMIAVIRALYPFDILYVLIPLYALSIILAFFNTKLFTAISFDSGGVATGAMAVSFILPMISGLSTNSNGFGTIALIACFPIVTMQILGFIYKLKLLSLQKLRIKTRPKDDFVLEFDYKKDFINKNIYQTEIIEFDYNKSKGAYNAYARKK